MSDDRSPTLIETKGMGGVLAQEGFDYQIWCGLVRLPAWLANPAFEELIFEGLEDVEARFFVPAAPRGRLLERYQMKRGSLSPADVRAVLQGFLSFEKAYPSAARLQTLVTPHLPATLGWLQRQPERVRRARPFYAPFADVVGATDADLLRQLNGAYDPELASFVATSVEIEERSLPDQAAASAVFIAALDRAFPHLDVSARRCGETFDALCGLVRRSTGVPLTRATLEASIEAVLGRPLRPSKTFTMNVRSDRSGVDEHALEIDASAFSGGRAGFPEPERWRQELIEPLDRTAAWLRGRNISRIEMRGSYRLTTAMTIGWALRSAMGFELEITTRDGRWATDDRPGHGDALPPWRIVEPSSLKDEILGICVGVLRDPGLDIEETAGIPSSAVLTANLAAPIANSRQAQAGVSDVKRAVDRAVQRLRPKRLRLFIAGPAAFAVALGHRWNAMPETQLHEFDPGTRRYVQTAIL